MSTFENFNTLRSQCKINKNSQTQATPEMKGRPQGSGWSSEGITEILVDGTQECSKPSDAMGHTRNQQRPDLANCPH